MSTLIHTIKDSLLHLFYPHVCEGCGSDALTAQSQLCAMCIHEIPLTGFEKYASNAIEKIFSGRIRFEQATAQLYFNKESLVQQLMHRFKYGGNKDLGKQLGVMMGAQLLESGRFGSIDALIPLPLFENKEKKRGFNQSTVLCEGIAEVMNIEIIDDVVQRPLFTETQTKKNRIERWKNMEGKFTFTDDKKIRHKHVLLVDDVITTGATIESCASTLLQAEGLTLSIATLCYASKL